MRSYTAEKYRRLVEETTDPTLRRYMDEERSFVARIPDIGRRTIVDVGAGHGRALADLAHLGERVIAAEINPDMYAGLAERATWYENVSAVHGDAFELGHLLDGDALERPAFVILQNTLGTIEGDFRDLLRVVLAETARADGVLVLSLYRQRALRDWGLAMYASVEEMVGAADLESTDLAPGRFVTTSGYTSKWWMDDEIEAFKRLGEVQDELVTEEYVLLRLAGPDQQVTR